jgi:uncharacterized membrane protein YgcG
MRTLGVLIAATFLVFTPVAASAATPDVPGQHITRWDETYTLHPDGSADVRLEIDFNFGNVPGHGPYLVLPTRQKYGKTSNDRLYATSGISASSPTGAPAGVNLDEGRNFIDVKIGDPNIGNVSGTQTYVITYSVAHVMNATSSSETTTEIAGDEFYWNAVGEGWTIPISNATVTVVSPTGALKAQCFAGTRGVTDPCDGQKVAGTNVTFTQAYLTSGQPLSVDTLYPQGTFATDPALVAISDVARAFALNAGTIGGAAVILCAGLFLLVRSLRTTAVDDQFAGLTPGLTPVGPSDGTVTKRNYKTPVAVRFDPPAGMRPGQIGTLIDEKADPRDVTATLVDLAVRGYLRIDDAGEKAVGVFSKEHDYTLVKLREADSALFPYEVSLFEALFAGGTQVKLSDLKTTFSTSMARVQKELYANVTLLGWFKRNPQGARAAWAGSGIAVLLVGLLGTFFLAQATRLALLPVPLILLGVMILATTGNAPARTAKGTAALQDARGFELYLTKAEANQLRFEEGEDLFSKYLPYAIAFGVADKWAKKFEELARQGQKLAEPTWYGGGFVYGAFWANAAGLGDRMNQFASFADAAMTAPTPGSSGGSGFGGGGGFSGGGGGGGGGGGW